MRGRQQRVVISAIGAITPIGSGVDGLWAGVLRGASAVRRLTRFDPSPFRSQLAAEIDDFDPGAYLEPRRARRLDRYSQLAVATSLQALDDAGLAPHSGPVACARCSIGSALGGVAFPAAQHPAHLRRG